MYSLMNILTREYINHAKLMNISILIKCENEVSNSVSCVLLLCCSCCGCCCCCNCSCCGCCCCDCCCCVLGEVAIKRDRALRVIIGLLSQSMITINGLIFTSENPKEGLLRIDVSRVLASTSLLVFSYDRARVYVYVVIRVIISDALPFWNTVNLEYACANRNSLMMYREDGDSKDKSASRIDIDKPLWNQDTYFGRWMHYAFITDCRTILVPENKLREAKRLCEDYKAGKEPKDLQRKDIIYAKQLRDSAFHPDNDEFMHVVGRMSFQLPGSVALTTAMLTFYKSTYSVIACQLINQGFNAFVNYTNRNAMSDDPQDTSAIQQAFVFATAASCAAALGFRKLLSGRGSLLARFAPFCAVAVGNIVNLPIMRQREIVRGIPIFVNDDEVCIMKSQVAAIKGISECVLTRIIMAAPGMLMIPVFTQQIRSHCFYQLRPWLAFPVEISLCTLCLLVMIPSALAIFPQKNSMKPELLKMCPEEYEIFQEKMSQRERPDRIYYNKGL